MIFQSPVAPASRDPHGTAIASGAPTSAAPCAPASSVADAAGPSSSLPTLTWLGLMAACVGLVYSVALGSRYFYSDDYALFIDRSEASLGQAMRDGRPIYAALLRWTRDYIRGDEFRTVFVRGCAVRLVSVLGIILLAWILFAFLARLKVPRFYAFAMSTMAVFLPAYQVYAAWTATWPYPLALAAGAGAIWLLHGGGPVEARFGRLATAAGLMGVALCIYQPAAMIAWALLLAWLLAEDVFGRREPTRRWLGAAAVAGGSVALYMAIYLALRAVLHLPDEPGRGLGGINAADKIHWFLTQALWTSLRFWIDPFEFRHGAQYVYLGILLLWAAGVLWRDAVVFCRERSGSAARLPRYALRPLAALALVQLSYLPNLAVPLNWASYRSLCCLPLALLMILAAPLLFQERFGSQPLCRTRRARVLVLTLLLAAAVRAQTNVLNYLVFPQRFEFAYLRMVLDQAHYDRTRPIHMICPQWYEGASGKIVQEMGAPSSSAPWVPVPMIHLALVKLGEDRADAKITFSADPKDVPKNPKTIVIDMRNLPSLR